MTKKRVVFLYGGKADEHSISCISAAGVLSAVAVSYTHLTLPTTPYV